MKLSRIVSLIVVFVLIVYFVFYLVSWIMVANPNPYVNSEINQVFLAMKKGANINQGIRLNSFGRAFGDQETALFFVKNFTAEDILFPDKAFGVVIYGIDEQNSSWKELTNIGYWQDPIELPAKTLGFSLENNSFFLFLENIKLEKVKLIRVYVEGVGKDTGIVYGAYEDYILP